MKLWASHVRCCHHHFYTCASWAKWNKTTKKIWADLGFWVTPLHWKLNLLPVVSCFSGCLSVPLSWGCISATTTRFWWSELWPRQIMAHKHKHKHKQMSEGVKWWRNIKSQRSTSLLHRNVLQIFNTRTPEQKETVTIFHIWSVGDTNIQAVLIVEIFGAAGLNTCVTLFCQNQLDSPNMNASRNFDCKRTGHKQRSLTKWSQISFVSWVSSGGTFCSVPPEQGTNMSGPASLPLVQLS